MGRMILAGIDEAGLGPTLGPLITACAALEVPDDWTPDSPWTHLADACAGQCGKKETRIGVADSKILHRNGGLAALELAVGAFSVLAHTDGGPRLDCDCGDAIHPCYSRSLAPFPAVRPVEEIDGAAEALRRNLERVKAAVVRLQAKALFEPVINRRYEQELNKNQVLLLETGSHIQAVVAAHPAFPMLVIVDKQGGRNDYLPFLMALFPGMWIDPLETGPEQSCYRLRRPGADVLLRFQAKADRTSFTTALASLAAKYARERAMEEFNAWFGSRLPGLRPTAGYPEDARRWLRDVDSERGRLKVELVVRNR